MSTENASKKKRSPLIYVLIPLLIVMIVALVIDRKARRQWEEAFDTVKELSDLGTDTMDDVHQALGKKPVKIDEVEGPYPLDHFRWRGGLPWKTYDLFVVYNEGDNAKFYDYAQSREELSFPVPSIAPALEEAVDEDPTEEPEDPMEEPSDEDSAAETSGVPGPELGAADGEGDASIPDEQ